ncbi:hypothetical protein QQZ08_008199 [Neonectria magnoliae]|uniref:Uncharacterized protein n=1 Tax=Neonectria magnoliae TaxID=2732573 RepID=A0ABR1HWH8_9HYPO
MQWKLYNGLHLWVRRAVKFSHQGSLDNEQGQHPPPPTPRDLLANRVIYEIPLLDRSRNRSVDRDTDTPLAALYRIYEHIVLDQHIEIRNEIEAFWYHADWAVRNIPDPRDPDPERYACLACIPALLCLAFNRRIELGVPRHAPPIFTRDMLDEWRAHPFRLGHFEDASGYSRMRSRAYRADCLYRVV